MKKILAAVLVSSMAVSAQAGSITYEPPQGVSVEIQPNMGIGGSWIIPAVIVSVIALAVLASPQPQPIPQ